MFVLSTPQYKAFEPARMHWTVNLNDHECQPLYRCMRIDMQNLFRDLLFYSLSPRAFALVHSFQIKEELNMDIFLILIRSHIRRLPIEHVFVTRHSEANTKWFEPIRCPSHSSIPVKLPKFFSVIHMDSWWWCARQQNKSISGNEINVQEIDSDFKLDAVLCVCVDKRLFGCAVWTLFKIKKSWLKIRWAFCVPQQPP